jgi:hypothetical protein
MNGHHDDFLLGSMSMSSPFPTSAFGYGSGNAAAGGSFRGILSPVPNTPGLGGMPFQSPGRMLRLTPGSKLGDFAFGMDGPENISDFFAPAEHDLGLSFH